MNKQSGSAVLLFVLMLPGAQVIAQPPGAPAPMYSVGATFDTDRDLLVLFGGYFRTYSGDTWIWQGRRWSRLPGPGPSARNGPQLAYDQKRRQVVMFGGDTRDTGALGDTWVLDATGWRQVASDGPPPRSGHTMAYDSRRGRVVMFGGNAGGQMFGDTWEWDGGRWARVATTGPSARALHAMAYDALRGKVVLFGGTPIFGPDAPSFGGTWEWDGEAWSHVASGGPTPRDHLFMVFDPVRRLTVLHGGGIGDSSAETWGFDGTTWALLSREGPPRRYAPVVFDSRAGTVLLYGGFDRAPSNELWEFASTGWRKLAPSR